VVFHLGRVLGSEAALAEGEQLQARCGECLTGAVVELSRDAAALLVLERDPAFGQERGDPLFRPGHGPDGEEEEEHSQHGGEEHASGEQPGRLRAQRTQRRARPDGGDLHAVHLHRHPSPGHRRGSGPTERNRTVLAVTDHQRRAEEAFLLEPPGQLRRVVAPEQWTVSRRLSEEMGHSLSSLARGDDGAAPGIQVVRERHHDCKEAGRDEHERRQPAGEGPGEGDGNHRCGSSGT